MQRPRVLLNFAVSLDGKIAPARKRAPFVMSRHPEDPKRMVALRTRSDAVLIGASNLRADDPDLMPSGLRIVVSRAGDGISPTARMFDPKLGGEAIVAHSAMMSAATRRSFEHHATLLEMGASDVDMPRLLEWLTLNRTVRVLLCEGGGVLAAQLFAAKAVDELYLTMVPRVLGGANAPTPVEGSGFEPDAIPDGRLAAIDRVGDEIFLTYFFDWIAS
jgi:riboflavin-specific deaminase-like protein